MPREVVVLGTASQAPTEERNHNGYVVRFDGLSILLDPGEGTQRQMLLAGVRSSTIDAIAISHSHGDHCLGLPGVLSRMALDQRSRPLTLIHGQDATFMVDHLLAVTHAAEHFEIQRIVMDDEDGGCQRLSADVCLRGLPLDHRVPALGYRVEQADGIRFDPDRLAMAGVEGADVRRLHEHGSIEVGGRVVRIEEVTEPRQGQVVAFAMDTRAGERVRDVVRDADLAIVEATYQDGDEALADQYGHMTASQAGHEAARAGVRRLLVTHFSQRYGPGGFGRQAGAVHPDVVEAADLLVVQVPPCA